MDPFLVFILTALGIGLMLVLLVRHTEKRGI